MKVLVISSAPVIKKNSRLYGYPPYVNEMDIWFRYFRTVTIISPGSYPIGFEVKCFKNKEINFINTSFLQFNSNITTSLKSIFLLPFIFYSLINEIRKSDHIHLRCPGNISLLGCIAQIFFPRKTKTAKYAGNWDPNSKQPYSYKFQKWILSNTYLSRNLKVLVYGNWQKKSKNVIPFFTASFSEMEATKISKDFTRDLNFIFVGSFSKGKRPLFAIKLAENLISLGKDVRLNLYGSGPIENELENYISNSKFSNRFTIEGFIKKEELKEVYLRSHFLILPSKSEGWPKAVAEAMFFGCIPISTDVSCVSWMLGDGKRGIIIPPNLEMAKAEILNFIDQPEILQGMSEEAQIWSQKYTLEKFEKEIKDLL